MQTSRGMTEKADRIDRHDFQGGNLLRNGHRAQLRRMEDPTQAARIRPVMKGPISRSMDTMTAVPMFTSWLNFRSSMPVCRARIMPVKNRHHP